MLQVIRRIICFCLFRRLALLREFPGYLQDRLTGKNLIDLSGPLSADNPLLIDEEKISLCSRRIPLSVQAPVAPDYLKIGKIT
jgi:hypothetical protein